MRIQVLKMASARRPEDQLQQNALSRAAGATSCWQSLLHAGDTSTSSYSNVCNLPLKAAAPVGVSLCAPRNYPQLLEKSPFSPRHLVDGLLRELQLRSQKSPQKKVPWLNWRLPQSIFDSAEVIEIMHYLSRQLHLGEVENCCYSVAFHPAELTETNAALFKGLGFNNIELLLDESSNLDAKTLRDCITTCKDFHYDTFNLVLSAPIPSLTAMLSAARADGFALPSSLTLNPMQQFMNDGDCFDQLFTGMRDLGYRVLGNDCFVSGNSALASAQNRKHLRLTSHGYNCQNVTDVIGLGPGNISSWGNLRSINPEPLHAYLSDTFSGQYCSSHPGNKLKPVIEQLLCYHNLDLNYFRQRYRWDLLPLIEKVWLPLQAEGSLLYDCSQGYLHLSAEGIRRLTVLCETLIAAMDTADCAAPGAGPAT